MSIPTDSKPNGYESTDLDNGINTIIGGETLAQRNERRLELIRSNEMNGANIFGFLLMLLSNAIDDNGNKLIDNETLDKVSDALGIDHRLLHQNITSISEKAIAPQEAAAKIYGIVDPETVDWSKASDVDMSVIIRDDTTSRLLNPDLLKAMENNPQIRQRVEWTFEAAKREGLDGNLLANQYWQESRFDPNAVSSAGAKGIAQFMPFHKGKWGLDNNDSFTDAKMSIDAGARFMKHLTEKLGSQELALVAYNGGEKAIDYVDRNTFGEGVTIGQWMEFMDQERATKGVGASHLWRNETFRYISKIDSNYWSEEKIALAQQQQTTLKSQFAQGGVETKDQKQPDPLVIAFDGEGRNQIPAGDGTAHTHDGANNTPNITVAPT